MVTFDCRAERVDGVTLVTATVGDIAEPTRITVRNCLDGPLWPPRKQGVPEAGWSEDRFEGIVESGTSALGYATPAPPSDHPAELVSAEPVPDHTTADERLDSADAVLRELGDPSPPVDAVPTAESVQAAETANAGPPDLSPEQVIEPRPAMGQPLVESKAASGQRPDQQLPDAVSQWLATVARRADRAERLAQADSLSAATAAVRAAEGLSGVRTVAARGDTDEQMLRALAQRAERLADRRAAATVPTEALSRLA
ncbi:hypothetical protein Har1130_14400 [Haloarcula sp. CBA1130]|uniref:DUF7857 domain-containing protein n=1 Tax=unclassified Haloarcula TaxID=2624677 RepID=UPI0012470D35|nr:MULTISPECIES: hypothetical protein [unclassified Haloarcula]KAA9399367.1 hypothetical protein Har1129_14500 [Haloarcula sp. CBA1129]KAA9403881.1 hypothetical protein Har1130_14400 [Haloarcula sp. CBA1130]